MKVALFSWESLHSVAVGGVAVHVSELARTLRSQGHDVHVFTRLGPSQTDEEQVGGVSYHRCGFPRSADLVEETDFMCGAFVNRFQEVDRQVDGFDVAHAHDWLTAAALTTARDNGRHQVFTIHSTEYGRCGNAHCEGRSRAIRDREWLGGYVADRVIAVSEHLKDEFRRLYRVPEEKMRVIYNGVDVHRFDLDVDVDVGAVKERHGLGRMDPTVLFCGRLAWQKGPDVLLEAVPPLLGHYPHAKFLYVGEGEMRSGLEWRAGELGVSHAVRFLGFRSGRDLVELFTSCDVVCVPSRNEPFGIVILEAWSAGKPVVATRNGGPSEFVRHGENGFVIDATADSVGWGLGTLFQDFENARRMGQAGRRDAETRFDWPAIARQVAGVYGE